MKTQQQISDARQAIKQAENKNRSDAINRAIKNPDISRLRLDLGLVSAYAVLITMLALVFKPDNQNRRDHKMKYSELTNHTNHAKRLKMTPAQAIAAILQDPATDNLDPITLAAIAMLINKVEKRAATKKDLSNPFWIAAQFMGKDDTRCYLNNIYSNGENLIASDGHRLVRIKQEAEPGFYTASGNLEFEPEHAKYPAFDLVYNQQWLDDQPVELAVFTGEKMLNPEKPFPVGAYTVRDAKNEPRQVWFNRAYIETVQKLGVTHAVIAANFSALKFEHDNFDGIVMPTRE